MKLAQASVYTKQFHQHHSEQQTGIKNIKKHTKENLEKDQSSLPISQPSFICRNLWIVALATELTAYKELAYIACHTAVI